MKARWHAFLGKGLAYIVAFFGGRQTAEPSELKPPVDWYPWEAVYPEDVDWRAEIAVKPLYAILGDAVARFPYNSCVEFLGSKYRYREIGRLVDCAAKGLQDLGVGKGVRVGLFLPNTPYFVVCYYAVLKAGGTVVNINPLYAEEEVLRLLIDTDARIVVTLDVKALYPKLAVIAEHARLEKLIVCRMEDALPFPQNHLFRL